MKKNRIGALMLAMLMLLSALPALAQSGEAQPQSPAADTHAPEEAEPLDPEETETAEEPQAQEPLVVEASTASPVPQGSPAPLATLPITDKKDMPKPEKDPKAEAIVTEAAGIPLYEAPSEGAAQVKQLEAGSVLSLKSLGLTWCEVQMGEDKGFVPTYALGFSYGSPQPVLALVTAPNGKLTIRAEMTTKSKALLTLKTGRAVLLLVRGETFSLVRYGDKEGYVLTAHLKEMPVNRSLGNLTEVVSLQGKKDANVRIRLTPTGKGLELTRVKSGLFVVVLDHPDADWAQVEYQGFSGYMMSDYLKKFD